MIKYALLFLVLLASPLYASHNGVCLVRLENGSCGSGFFVEDNKVVTAWHVIEPNVKSDCECKVRIEFGNTIAIAKVIKESEETDVALLEVLVEGETLLKLSNISPTIGDKLTNKGHPKGAWDCHSSPGELTRVANVTRQRFNSEEKMTSRQYITKANVTVGMSGGPVLNKMGEVVGLISAKSLDSTTAYCPTLEQIKDILK